MTLDQPTILDGSVTTDVVATLLTEYGSQCWYDYALLDKYPYLKAATNARKVDGYLTVDGMLLERDTDLADELDPTSEQTVYYRASVLNLLYFQPASPSTLPASVLSLPFVEQYSPYFGGSDFIESPKYKTNDYYLIELGDTLDGFIENHDRKYRQELRRLNRDRTIYSHTNVEATSIYLRSLSLKYLELNNATLASALSRFDSDNPGALHTDIGDKVYQAFWSSVNLYSNHYYTTLLTSGIFAPGVVRVLDNLDSRTGELVSVSLCLSVGHTLFGVTDIVLCDRPVTKEVTLANAEWCIRNGYRFYDVENAAPDKEPSYQYKKPFFTSEVPTPVRLHQGARPLSWMLAVG